MVDDVLLFLSYLIKAPALPVRPTWLPSPITIMTQAAASVMLAASPSSSRSHASSVRQKRKSGQGSTPTSVRSFSSDTIASSSQGSDSFHLMQRRTRDTDSRRSSRSRSYRRADNDEELEAVSEVSNIIPQSTAEEDQNSE